MKKQNFNLHTHTIRCGHALGLDVQYVESAIDAGFTTLGFSDHVPYKGVHVRGDRMDYDQKEDYLTSIQTLKETYKDKIDIKIGFEIEYLAEYDTYLTELRNTCDYFILGQHCKYIGYEYDCYSSDDDVITYAKQIEAALSKGFITYVAHPDYFMLGRRSFSAVCEEAAHIIAKASIAYNTPLEINLNGFRYGKNTYSVFGHSELRYPYPFREFWDIIASYGCKVVYGYDAHSPITLQEAYREDMADEILSGLNLQYIDTIILK